MARQTPILRKSFPADTAVGANVCVCESPTNVGNVALPANTFQNGLLNLANAGVANAGTRFVGVTAQAADTNNEVPVDVAGIVQIQTDGSANINAGDLVAIANVSGQVKTVVPNAPAVPGTTANWYQRQIIGIAMSTVTNTAGLLVDVLLQPHTYLGV